MTRKLSKRQIRKLKSAGKNIVKVERTELHQAQHLEDLSRKNLGQEKKELRRLNKIKLPKRGS